MVIFLAILWSADTKGNKYEVRSAGRTVRLYTNGVFHSQFNPNRIFGGGLWDLMSLPVFYSPIRANQKVLILGLGGGAVLKQLDCCLDSSAITAVELDPVHLEIANKWFKVSSTKHRLYNEDAVEWLAHYQGSPFDFIIDDLFGHEEGDPCRAVCVDNDWAQLLLQNLNCNGTLVVNYSDKREALRSALLDQKPVKSSWFLNHPRYHNCIGAHLNFQPTKNSLKANILENPSLSGQDKRIALAITVKRFLKEHHKSRSRSS